MVSASSLSWVAMTLWKMNGPSGSIKLIPTFMPLSAPKVRKEIDQQWGSWTFDLEQWPQGKGDWPSHLGGPWQGSSFRPVLNIRGGLRVECLLGWNALLQASSPKVPNRRRQMPLTPWGTPMGHGRGGSRAEMKWGTTGWAQSVFQSFHGSKMDDGREG